MGKLMGVGPTGRWSTVWYREEVNIDWFEILKLLCKISPAEF